MRSTEETPHGAYFLGVDGGGSKTLAVLVDAAGREHGRGLAGGANAQAIGIEAAVAQIRLAVAAATSASGCQAPFAAAWFGLAGIDTSRDHSLLLPHLCVLANVVHLTNDAELTLGALPGCVGVALIAGTGSIALGRNASGAQARAGGWGHLVGDEGSGYDLGRHALQAALRAADGRGPATQLLDSILATWELRNPEDLISRVYPSGDKSEIARISRLVFAAAQHGDPVARRIVRRGAAELALAALTVSKALGFDAGVLSLALGGGVLLHETDLRDEVVQLIRRKQAVESVVLVEEPAVSAARAAGSLRQTAKTMEGK